MFELALKRNQTEFVKLFLDHDFSLTEVFRNKDILPSLYMNSTREVYNRLFIYSKFIILISCLAL
jgi:predicted DNA-binding protein YlxM (UPF0122 family)